MRFRSFKYANGGMPICGPRQIDSFRNMLRVFGRLPPGRFGSHSSSSTSLLYPYPVDSPSSSLPSYIDSTPVTSPTSSPVVSRSPSPIRRSPSPVRRSRPPPRSSTPPPRRRRSPLPRRRRSPPDPFRSFSSPLRLSGFEFGSDYLIVPADSVLTIVDDSRKLLLHGPGDRTPSGRLSYSALPSVFSDLEIFLGSNSAFRRDGDKVFLYPGSFFITGPVRFRL